MRSDNLGRYIPSSEIVIRKILHSTFLHNEEGRTLTAPRELASLKKRNENKSYT